ncbi:MAG: peptidoglycan-binding protein [Gammaproteobacteria bacterium]
MSVSITSSSSDGLQSGFSDASSELRAPTYEVEQGDTISSIASRHGVEVADLMAANPDITNPNVIYVGDTVVLPTAGQYTVQSGDNLASIAARFDSSVEAIISANQIDNPNLIYVGDVLSIPGTTGTVAPAPDAPVVVDVDLSRGSSGDQVESLQTALDQLGYAPGGADGQFGPRTEQALETFQTDFGLPATGVADATTRAALDVVVNSPSELAVGASGPEVNVLQRGLNELGFSAGPVDGQFGPLTQNAVSQFQTANGLEATGVADADTLSALRSGDAEGPAAPPTVTPGGPIAPTWDPVSDTRIQSLHPDVRAQAAAFVNQVEAQLGIQVRVTSGLRTFSEQNALYAQGRTTPGNIVTNARGGSSYHNYGLALDVVPMNAQGQPVWDSPHWDAIGQLGKQMGFDWGGDFRSIVDKPHFQMDFGNSTRDLLSLYNSGQRDGPYVNL